jgi:hypothetical protein
MGKKETNTKEKPLEKMTATELREMAIKNTEITGAQGMNKQELLSAVKQARGIAETGKKAASSIREIKQKIKALKVKCEGALTAKDSKTATIFRRRISRLKKKTRMAL